jgi:hypothetical protein
MTAMSARSASAIDAANPFSDLPAIRGPKSSPEPARSAAPTTRQFPSPRFGDYSRTRFESRVAFGGPDEDAVGVATPSRQFTLLEITSGLPEDCYVPSVRAWVECVRFLTTYIPLTQGFLSLFPDRLQGVHARRLLSAPNAHLDSGGRELLGRLPAYSRWRQPHGSAVVGRRLDVPGA